MEYRKYYNTPRERIDDDLLLKIMSEDEISCCSYGDSGRNARRQAKAEAGCSTCPTRVIQRQDNSSADNNDCGCDENCAKKNCLSGYHLAMSYTPDQEWQLLYNDEDAMSHGTIFTELFKPFYHGCNGSCR